MKKILSGSPFFLIFFGVLGWLLYSNNYDKKMSIQESQVFRQCNIELENKNEDWIEYDNEVDYFRKAGLKSFGTEVTFRPIFVDLNNKKTVGGYETLNCLNNDLIFNTLLKKESDYEFVLRALNKAGSYSLWHSYSIRGHLLDIEIGSMSLSMGHSIETHCREYPWATKSATTNAFELALAA